MCAPEDAAEKGSSGSPWRYDNAAFDPAALSSESNENSVACNPRTLACSAGAEWHYRIRLTIQFAVVMDPRSFSKNCVWPISSLIWECGPYSQCLSGDIRTRLRGSNGVHDQESTIRCQTAEMTPLGYKDTINRGMTQPLLLSTKFSPTTHPR